MSTAIEEARSSGDLDKALALINVESKKAGGLSVGLAHQYGLTLMAGGKYGKALEMMLMCVSKAPHESQLWLNTAQCAEAIGDWEAALRAYDACVKIPGKNQAQAQIGRGSNLFRLGMQAYGVKAWKKALAIDTDPAPSFQRSQILLAFGEWDRGFADYEGRRALEGWRNGVIGHGVAPEHLPEEWQGEPGRVLVYGEQGAGDLVMLSRYLPLVERASVSPPAVLFGAAVNPFVPYTQHTDDCQWAIPAGSLFRIFGVIPPVTTWRKPAWNAKPRIGICWKGSPHHTNDKDRSSPIDFRDVLQDERWELVSLQYGYGFSPKDYAETAELMRTLDAVVTVDTSVVHLAGTLGVPTVLIPPAAHEWRWGVSGDTTPWYPSITIVRRKKADAWPEAIERAKRALVGIVA